MARVIRCGSVRAIPATEIVRGDWIVLAEGDRVPADGLLRALSNLRVDESLLTGESVAVGKRLARTEDTSVPEPGGEDAPCVYAGTLVVSGLGVAEVVATGAASAIGRIGVALRSISGGASSLERETSHLVRVIGALALAVCVLVLVWLGLERGDWIEALLAALALAISLVPEEIPVVMAIFIAMGAWRMAQHKVLARRLPAVEALGAMTVLALDKTGTLTENRMRVVRLIAPTGQWAHGEALADELHRLLEFAALASHRNAFDPMEQAIEVHASQQLAATEHLHSDWQHLREYPLSPELLAVSHAWTDDTGAAAIAAKGAPEAIGDLCHLDPPRRTEVLARAHELAADGLRVLGVAAGHHTGPLPERQHDFEFEFLGLVGLADPLRADAAAAIAQLRRAGVRVVMITGDYPATALAIARAAG
ncbi:MAG: HAD-IC family P-type ATPase, partial [Burkholderiaceae bacterium]